MSESTSIMFSPDLVNIPVVLVNCECEIGENPLWHPDWNMLLWVDIPKGVVFGYNPAVGNAKKLYQGEVTGGFTIQENGDLLLFQKGGAIRCWSNGNCITLLESIDGEESTRFNDVFADKRGRVFAGTMSGAGAPGRLYRFDSDGCMRILDEGIGISNGIGVSPDDTILYHIDSGIGTIWCYDYDEASGNISSKRVFVDFPLEQGVPDGMKIDGEGNLWVAFWGGGCVRVVSPSGVVIQKIDFPAPQISSLAAGLHGVIYVTSATEGRPDNIRAPEEGALFAFRSTSVFLPTNRSRIPEVHV